MKTRQILIVNDDGIFAPGIKHLTAIARRYGEVLVVAPDSPRSGQSHAVTLSEPLRLREEGTDGNVRYFSCNGSPADCAKLAVKVVYGGKHPDFLFSGINHGSNAASNVIYSGTVAGIIEGSLNGVPAVAFSLMDHSLNADFKPILPWVEKVMVQAIEATERDRRKNRRKSAGIGVEGLGIGSGTICWNVNFPKVPARKIKGIKVCRLGEALWAEDALEREDPSGRKYYWMKGDFVKTDRGDDCDLAYLDKGYISLTPLHTDWTDYPALKRTEALFEN